MPPVARAGSRPTSFRNPRAAREMRGDDVSATTNAVAHAGRSLQKRLRVLNLEASHMTASRFHAVCYVAASIACLLDAFSGMRARTSVDNHAPSAT